MFLLDDDEEETNAETQADSHDEDEQRLPDQDNSGKLN